MSFEPSRPLKLSCDSPGAPDPADVETGVSCANEHRINNSVDQKSQLEDTNLLGKKRFRNSGIVFIYSMLDFQVLFPQNALQCNRFINFQLN